MEFVRICYGCKKNKSMKDFKREAVSLLNDYNSKHSFSHNRNKILSDSNTSILPVKIDNCANTNVIESTVTEIFLCNECWKVIEDGEGIVDPREEETPEININSYMP